MNKKPHISLIVARARNGVIGNQGKLPWHFSEDLKFFKQVTMGKPIIMGRNTWESIGRPLPGRRNVVLTSDMNYKAEGAQVVHSLKEALGLFNSQETIFIIGGAQLYRYALPFADTAWVTEIDHDFEGDVTFDTLDPKAWKLVWSESFEVGEGRQWPFKFQRFERIKDKVYSGDGVN